MKYPKINTLWKRDEFMKAMGGIFRLDGGTIDGMKPSDVWKEAADCCNFITMMAVNYERQWYEDRKES